MIMMMMENYENVGCIFPLTSLQIGDLQSYLSHLHIFFTDDGNRFYILVDNRPWLEAPGSRRAHLWQLMVTKSRLSPFANSRARKGKHTSKEESVSKTSSKITNPNKCTRPTKISEKWFSLIDAATLSQKKAMLPMKKLKYSLQLNRELHTTLFGLIIFEVSWDDVRGINYLNELQTDTSLALEAKFMRRWEFDSIMQAVGCISTWFTGAEDEQDLLRDYLLSTVDEVFYDAEEHLSDEKCTCDVAVENASSYGISVGFNEGSKECENDTNTFHTPPPLNVPYKRRKVTRTSHPEAETDSYSEGTPKTPLTTFDPFRHCESAIEATKYKDVLILFRFSDRDLPFKLKDIIMNDLRLLTLLESGLPSWVIFLQSYPVFCHLYRPWMCPLARALYVIISITTVVIGFYDLYKNVPLLKATASRLLGPLFDWIETWEMVSRVKYLGTMLFLHNFEKAVTWLLTATRTMRSFFSVLAQPIAEPLVEFSKLFLPFWTLCIQMTESCFSFTCIILGSSYSFIGNIVEVVLSPIWFILSFVWNAAMCIILPFFWACWEIFYAPVRLILALFSLIAFVCALVYETLGELWSYACSIVQIASTTEATVKTTYEVSLWRSLWNDLFSKVFRAVRSILNGFVAFFTACNRHRLSIYNHIKELIQKFSLKIRRPHHITNHHRKRHVDPQRQAQPHRTRKLVEAANKEHRDVKR